MKDWMRYKIKSGAVTEIRDVMMTVRRSDEPKEKRAPRRKGNSPPSQVKRNEKSAVLQLGRLINENFHPGDIWLTLKYPDGKLPATREAAEHLAKLFLRRLARAYEKLAGEKLFFVMATADRSSKTGEPVRLHHHLVLPKMPVELIWKNWSSAETSIRLLDGRRDYTGIARYMLQNVSPAANRKRWTCARGMKRPEYTEPVPVKRPGGFRLPKGAVVMEREISEDRETGFSSAYIRYVLRPPEEPRRRSGKRNAGREEEA